MSNIPDEYICSLSESIMINPITLGCGHSFEKEAITNWIRQKSSCPVCNYKTSDAYLYPNNKLKFKIQKFNQEQDELAIDNGIEDLNLDESFLSTITACASSRKEITNLCLKCPNFSKRRPVSFVCIIDVSGSMDDIVGLSEGSKAFTRLDLVKHVLKVMIASLTESDRLGIITFSDEASIVFDLNPMNSTNKKLANESVLSLSSYGGTHTSSAIIKSYELIRKAPKSHLKSIILLTDGQDSNGSDALVEAFRKIKQPSQVQFNTFGFSNDIYSNCLEKLALLGGGIFGFIPDQSMIGTIFINYLSNTFLTLVQYLYIELSDGSQFLDSNSNCRTAVIQSGKEHNFLITGIKEFRLRIGFKPDCLYEIKVNFEDYNRKKFSMQNCRFKMLEILSKFPQVNIEKYEKKLEKCSEFLNEIKQSENPDPNNEQIKLSLNYWSTWGEHYIRSFRFAHMLEQAINFKSPSMVFYRSIKFDQFTDKLTEIFVNLPPPIPSAISHDNGQQINISNIMNRNNGCILSSCLVKLKSGKRKKVMDLKKEEVLSTGSKVVCLVKSFYEGYLIKIGNLTLTPYHPIFYDSEWKFPIDVYLNDSSKASLIKTEKKILVCNLVLDQTHYADIENYKCITLGHGYNHNKVLKHPYYGSEKCIQDLKCLKGWNKGCVKMENYSVSRDKHGYVVSMNVEQV